MTIYNLENLAGVHSSMHIHILCTTEIQLLETQVTVCCCIPLLTVLTKRSLFSSFSYCLQFNILESHTSHFCWHILQYVFLVIKIVQKTSVLYYSVFCCIFTVNVIALLNCKKKIGKLLPSIVCHITMNCRALLLRFVKNIINFFFSFFTSFSSICHNMNSAHTSQWVGPLSFISSGCLTKVLKVNMNTVHSVRVTVSSLFTQLHVYHNFLNSQSPLHWNPGKP